MYLSTFSLKCLLYLRIPSLGNNGTSDEVKIIPSHLYIICYIKSVFENPEMLFNEHRYILKNLPAKITASASFCQKTKSADFKKETLIWGKKIPDVWAMKQRITEPF